MVDHQPPSRPHEAQADGEKRGRSTPSLRPLSIPGPSEVHWFPEQGYPSHLMPRGRWALGGRSRLGANRETRHHAGPCLVQRIVHPQQHRTAWRGGSVQAVAAGACLLPTAPQPPPGKGVWTGPPRVAGEGSLRALARAAGARRRLGAPLYLDGGRRAGEVKGEDGDPCRQLAVPSPALPWPEREDLGSNPLLSPSTSAHGGAHEAVGGGEVQVLNAGEAPAASPKVPGGAAGDIPQQRPMPKGLLA